MKKKIVTLFLAAAMLLGVSATTTQAIDFKAKGVWITMMEYGQGGNFVKENRSGGKKTGYGLWNEDEFETKTRVRLQLEAVASESLSGTVYFEAGSITWGRGSQGGALGADGKIIKIKHAYMDWAIPNTNIKTRMGVQRIFLPDYASEASQVFDADVAGITINAPVNDNFSITAFWARPINDNWGGSADYPTNYLDNVDLFALSLPFSFEGLKITPWAMVGMIGKNAHHSSAYNYDSYYTSGILPPYFELDNNKVERNPGYAYGTAFWAGLTGEYTGADPFRVAWSFNYGSIDSGESALDHRGWYASALAEYKMDWGTPGIYAWYSSGDDDNPRNGSEQLANFSYNNECTSGFSGFATLGTWTLGRDALLGYTLAGTWGFGLRIKDISFIEKLSHTIRANFYNGTNAPKMARYLKGELTTPGHTGIAPFGGDFNGVGANGGIYLTQQDYAAEFGLMTSYQMYDNFRIHLEANYIALWLDQSSDVWGGYTNANGEWVKSNSTRDCWNVNVSFIYKF